MPANVPNIGEDTVFILGGGPSLPDLIKDKPIYDYPVIGINNAFRFGDWVDICWFADSRFYWWHRKAVDAYKGMKFSYNRHPELLGSLINVPSIKIVKGKPGQGISKKVVKFNASSGGSSINFAYHLGAKKIILVGFDMRVIAGESNWWKYDVPRDLDKPYDGFIKPFTKIKEDADRLGIEILNATPDSALTMFKSVELDAYIKRI